MTISRPFGCVLLALSLTPVLGAAQAAPVAGYRCRFVQIPVRDGVHLNTSICQPSDSGETLPFLLTRTPYGIAGDTSVGGDYRFLAADRYIFVFQDIRGRFGSEGEFVMNRPLHDPADPRAWTRAPTPTTPSSGCSRTCPNNNGRVGMLGVSYPGLLATMAGINPHPAMKAISPAGADDRHLDGRRLLSPGRVPALATASSTPPSWSSARTCRCRFRSASCDTYDWYLQLGPAGQRRREVLPRKSPDLERLRRPSGLRRVLAARAVQRAAHRAGGADADGGRMVGPGGLLRPAGDLRGARARDTGAPQLPGDGPVEPRRMARRGARGG